MNEGGRGKKMKLLNDKRRQGKNSDSKEKKKSRRHIKRNTIQGIGHTKDGVGREGVTQGNKRRDGAWEQEGEQRKVTFLGQWLR